MVFFSLLILAAAEAGSISAPAGRVGNPSYEAGALVFHSAFGPDKDQNHDRWPDAWRRRVGQGFPRHVAMTRMAEQAAPGGHALCIELNAAAASAYSQPIDVLPHYAYVVSVAVRTQGLRHDRALVSWRLLDADKKVIGETMSAPVMGDRAWTTLTLPPAAFDDPKVRHACVGLHARPGDPADLGGSICFADVRVYRQPRLRVAVTPPSKVLSLADKAAITCQASGLDGSALEGQVRLTMELHHLADAGAGGAGEGAPSISQAWDLAVHAQDQASRVHHATWSGQLPTPGLYRLRFRLHRAAQAGQDAVIVAEQMTTLAVLALPLPATFNVLAERAGVRGESRRPEPHPTSAEPEDRIERRALGTGSAAGTFGWSLPESSPTLPDWPARAEQLGVGVVKLPLWQSAEHASPRETAATTVEQLFQRRVRVIGVLARPPAEVREALWDEEHSDNSVAAVLTAPPEKLLPHLKATIMPSALQVHAWQLGADRDHSLDDAARAAAAVQALETELAKQGLPVNFALPNPPQPLPVCARYVPASMPWTEIESGQHFGGFGQRTWLTIEPPSIEPPSMEKSRGGWSQAITELVLRLVAAAATGAETVLVHDPFHAAAGMFHVDGSPGELLVPWHTTASHLSGAKCLGQLVLPGGSENRVFQRDGHVVVVLWNREAGTETLLAGQAARALDVWGRALETGRRGLDLRVATGPMPIFIADADPALVSTQLGVAMEPATIPSIPSRPHALRVRVPNCFGRQMRGTVTLHVPERWRLASRPSVPLDVPPGGQTELEFHVRLPLDGASGRQGLRLEFELSSEGARRFTVYREIGVGAEDAELTATAQLDEHGNLLVRQRLIHRGPAPANFTCQLSIPGRQTQTVFLRTLSPGTHEHVYTLPNGRELLGKTLRLRVEQPTSRRVMSQWVTPSR